MPKKKVVRDEKGHFLKGNQESKGLENNGAPCEYCPNKESILKITNEYLAKCESIKGVSGVPFIEALQLKLKCDDETILEWAKRKTREGKLEHPDFNAAIKRLKIMQRLGLLEKTLGRFNPTGAIFQLKVNHGMIETEKRILAGDSHEPLEIIITEEKSYAEPTD
ncbi:MAG: hypothetical protein ACYC6W_12525 [Nitrosotalea sp.]